MIQDNGVRAGSRAAHEAADASSPKASIPDAVCHNCDGTKRVCEYHPDRPWGGMSKRADACDCGAGMPCGACNLRMASARYSEPWRELADWAICRVADAVKDTSWGQPTFGPDYDEELRAAYEKLLAGDTP